MEKRCRLRRPIILSVSAFESSARSSENPYLEQRTKGSFLTCRSLDYLQDEEYADAVRRCPECETIESVP